MDVLWGLVDFIEDRNEEASGFACAIFGSGDDAFPGDDKGDGLFLNRSRYEVSWLRKCEDDIFFKFELVKIFVFGGFDVLL